MAFISGIILGWILGITILIYAHDKNAAKGNLFITTGYLRKQRYKLFWVYVFSVILSFALQYLLKI